MDAKHQIGEVVNLQIERQVERLHQVAEPAARAAATELVASVLELHRAALQRMLEILEQSCTDSPVMFAAFERDELVRAVLLLHDLHSQDLNQRVIQMLQDLGPKLQKFGATTQLLRADESGVKLIIHGCGQGCGSTGEMVRSMVEASLVGVAPDAAEIVVEIGGADRAFVPIDSIQPAHQTSFTAGANS